MKGTNIFVHVIQKQDFFHLRRSFILEERNSNLFSQKKNSFQKPVPFQHWAKHRFKHVYSQLKLYKKTNVSKLENHLNAYQAYKAHPVALPSLNFTRSTPLVLLQGNRVYIFQFWTSLTCRGRDNRNRNVLLSGRSGHARVTLRCKNAFPDL